MDFNSSSVPPNFMPLPPYLLPQYHQANKEIQALQQFWHEQLFDIQNAEVFKSKKQLPLARIRRIMKADKDVKMISAEAPLLFAKACEIFIQELTLRAWMCTEENKRHTLRRCDIAKAIKREDVVDFLANVVHCDHAHDIKEMNAGKEENQAFVSHAASFVENTMTNMGEMVASDQQFSQPQMMLPPYTYSFPYNFHPK